MECQCGSVSNGLHTPRGGNGFVRNRMRYGVSFEVSDGHTHGCLDALAITLGSFPECSLLGFRTSLDFLKLVFTSLRTLLWQAKVAHAYLHREHMSSKCEQQAMVPKGQEPSTSSTFSDTESVSTLDGIEGHRRFSFLEELSGSWRSSLLVGFGYAWELYRRWEHVGVPRGALRSGFHLPCQPRSHCSDICEPCL